MIEGAKALVAALAARLGRPVRLKLLEDYAEVLSATTSGATIGSSTAGRTG